MKSSFPFLKTGTIKIIPLEEKHLEPLRLLRNDPETSYYLTSVMPINPVAQQAWFHALSLDSSKMYLSILLTDNTFVGLVRCDEWDKINQSIRIGVDIVSTYRRKGLATQAYELLFDFLFHQLHIHRIWLLVADYNTNAIALYKKLGFVVEGRQRDMIYRNGSYHDYIMMSILKNEKAT